jgi:hypothetical protein
LLEKSLPSLYFWKYNILVKRDVGAQEGAQEAQISETDEKLSNRFDFMFLSLVALPNMNSLGVFDFRSGWCLPITK